MKSIDDAGISAAIARWCGHRLRPRCNRDYLQQHLERPNILRFAEAVPVTANRYRFQASKKAHYGDRVDCLLVKPN